MKIMLGPLVGGLSHNRANIWTRADSDSPEPAVKFTLHYKRKDGWATASVTT